MGIVVWRCWPNFCTMAIWTTWRSAPKWETGEYYSRIDSGLSPTDKLVVIHEAAQGLAALHGYSGGVIVHSDLKLSQILFTEEGFIKLNDFNRAEVLLWEDRKQDDNGHNNDQPATGGYCISQNGAGITTKAQEEYTKQPIDESADIFSFGAIVYGVLTGNYLYSEFFEINNRTLYEVCGCVFVDFNISCHTHFFWPPSCAGTHFECNIARASKHFQGKSFEEDTLLQVMRKCLAFEPERRPSIFELVEFMETALVEMDKN